VQSADAIQSLIPKRPMVTKMEFGVLWAADNPLKSVSSSRERGIYFFLLAIHPLVSSSVIHHIHCFPSPGTFVVMRFEKNSLIMVPPAFPAIPMAALVKTSPIPRSA